jgi:NADH-quinone oxidoreductase subunit J
MRTSIPALVLAALVAFAGLTSFAAMTAAQPAAPTAPTRAAPTRAQPGTGSAQAQVTGQAPKGGAVAPEPYRPHDYGDIDTGTGATSKPMALAFWLFALITVGGAIFVITRKNLIAAVMGMVGSFFGVAATYMMLYASFLAVVQMLVYAGAIMVLFVFVIMILNKPEDEPWGGVGLFGKGIAGLGMAYLAFRLVSLVWNVVPLKTSVNAPAAVKVMVGKESAEYAWGTTRAVGNTLFNNYLFPFEAVSILLLVAVVGAIAVARPLKDDDGVPPPEGMP